MARRVQLYVENEALKHVAYHILTQLNPEQKSKLNERDLAKLDTEPKIKYFCTNERVDFILHILAKIGYEWTIRIEKTPAITDELERWVQDQFLYPQKGADITEALAREGTVVISSRETMLNSHILAMDCNSKAFILSDFTNALTKKKKGWNQMPSFVETRNDAVDVWEQMAKVLLEQLNSFDDSQNKLGLTQDQLRIMSSLFVDRRKALTTEEIMISTQLEGKKNFVSKQLLELKERNLILGERKATRIYNADAILKNYYILSTKGVGLMCEYIQRVHEKSFKK